MAPPNRADLRRQLERVIPADILPIWRDDDHHASSSVCSRLDPAFLSLLVNEIADSLLGDDLLFLCPVLLRQGYVPRTIEPFVTTVYNGAMAVARTFGVDSRDAWHADLYLCASYECTTISPELRTIRTQFWRRYVIAALHTQRWVALLPEREQRVYARFVLPGVNPDMVMHFTRRSRYQ